MMGPAASISSALAIAGCRGSGRRRDKASRPTTTGWPATAPTRPASSALPAAGVWACGAALPTSTPTPASPSATPASASGCGMRARPTIHGSAVIHSGTLATISAASP